METKIERDKDGWPVLKHGMLVGRIPQVRLAAGKGGLAMMLGWVLQEGYLTTSDVIAYCRKFLTEFSADDGTTWHPYTQVQPKPLAPERVWVTVAPNGLTCMAYTPLEHGRTSGAEHRVEYVRADAVKGCIDYVREVAAGR
jgi:hypothetical protein